MFKNILVVCIGNICRSPTAEALINARYGDRGVKATSAGLGALKNAPMDPMALAVLRENGHDHEHHVARQINGEILAAADLVLVMEKDHLQQVRLKFPQASGKTMLLGKFDSNIEVPDPYRQQKPAFDHAYKIIESAVSSWDKFLR